MAKQNAKRQQERMKSIDLGNALAVPKDPGVTLKAVMHTVQKAQQQEACGQRTRTLGVPELKQQRVHGSSDPWPTHLHFYTVCTRL